FPPRCGVLQTEVEQAAVHAGGDFCSTGRQRTPAVKTKKRVVATLTVVAVLLAAGFFALAQQPYQLAPMEESKRDRAVSVSASASKYWVLPATLETTQWGWLDPNEAPNLVVNSGDTVAIETIMRANNSTQPASR